MLMGLSSGIALAGIGIAVVLLARATARRPTASRAAPRRSHALLLNKYYVDELYDAVDRPADQALSRRRAVEGGRTPALIDGAVNGVGAAVRGTSSGAAPPAVRLGPRLRGVAVPGSRRRFSAGILWTVDDRCLLTTIVFSAAGRRAAGAARRRARRSPRARGDGAQRRARRRRSSPSRRRCCLWWRFDPAERRVPVRREPRRGCRTSASPTTSAWTASACS